MIRKEAKLAEITIGETICARLKIIYFNEKQWIECYKEIAQKLNSLKQKMYKFYSLDSELFVLNELRKYADEDIKDVLDCST